MWTSFRISTSEAERLTEVFREAEGVVRDDTDLGFGFRKQLADELSDAAFFVGYRSFATDLYSGFPQIAVALISFMSPKDLNNFRFASFQRDERVKTDVEAVGRQKAVEVIGAFYSLAWFVRSKRFWNLPGERRAAREAIDKALSLFSLLGYELDKKNSLESENAH